MIFLTSYEGFNIIDKNDKFAGMRSNNISNCGTEQGYSIYLSDNNWLEDEKNENEHEILLFDQEGCAGYDYEPQYNNMTKEEFIECSIDEMRDDFKFFEIDYLLNLHSLEIFNELIKIKNNKGELKKEEQMIEDYILHSNDFEEIEYTLEKELFADYFEDFEIIKVEGFCGFYQHNIIKIKKGDVIKYIHVIVNDYCDFYNNFVYETSEEE